MMVPQSDGSLPRVQLFDRPIRGALSSSLSPRPRLRSPQWSRPGLAFESEFSSSTRGGGRQLDLV